MEPPPPSAPPSTPCLLSDSRVNPTDLRTTPPPPVRRAWEEAEASPNDDDITVPTCEHHRAASFGEEREGETRLPYSFDDEKAL